MVLAPPPFYTGGIFCRFMADPITAQPFAESADCRLWLLRRFTKTAALERRNTVKSAGHRIPFCDEYRNLNTLNHG